MNAIVTGAFRGLIFYAVVINGAALAEILLQEAGGLSWRHSAIIVCAFFMVLGAAFFQPKR